jgi:hypothetical protein
MSRLWSFVRKKSNREILTWAGGGLVAVAIGFWTVFTFVLGEKSTSVQASCGSVAFVGTITGGTVTAGGATGADCSRKK